MSFWNFILALAIVTTTSGLADAQILSADDSGRMPFGLPKLNGFGQEKESASPKLPSLRSLFGGGREPNAVLGASTLLGSVPNSKPDGSSAASTAGGLFGGLPKLFGGANNAAPRQPTVIDQFNSKGKNMVDRTSDWARTKQLKLKEKTFGRLTGGLGSWFGANNSGNGANNTPATAGQVADPASPAKPSYYSPARPPVRQAAQPGDGSTMRF